LKRRARWERQDAISRFLNRALTLGDSAQDEDADDDAGDDDDDDDVVVDD
jgi:hypothetical protein